MGQSNATEFRVVTLSSALDETPEGFYEMERLRRAEADRRAKLTLLEREIEDAVSAEIDRAIFYGGQP